MERPRTKPKLSGVRVGGTTRRNNGLALRPYEELIRWACERRVFQQAKVIAGDPVDGEGPVYGLKCGLAGILLAMLIAAHQLQI